MCLKVSKRIGCCSAVHLIFLLIVSEHRCSRVFTWNSPQDLVNYAAAEYPPRIIRRSRGYALVLNSLFMRVNPERREVQYPAEYPERSSNCFRKVYQQSISHPCHKSSNNTTCFHQLGSFTYREEVDPTKWTASIHLVSSKRTVVLLLYLCIFALAIIPAGISYTGRCDFYFLQHFSTDRRDPENIF